MSHALDMSVRYGPATMQLMSVQGAIARTIADVRLATAALSVRDARDPLWNAATSSGRTRGGKRVLFFLIDCMRLDQWRTLEESMETMFTIERDNYISILPTATPFARNAIFAGELPLTA